MRVSENFLGFYGELSWGGPSFGQDLRIALGIDLFFPCAPSFAQTGGNLRHFIDQIVLLTNVHGEVIERGVLMPCTDELVVSFANRPLPGVLSLGVETESPKETFMRSAVFPAKKIWEEVDSIQRRVGFDSG